MKTKMMNVISALALVLVSLSISCPGKPKTGCSTRP